MVVSLFAALLTVGVVFGLNLGDKQQAAILAVVQLAVGLVVRSQVVPVASAPPAAK